MSVPSYVSFSSEVEKKIVKSDTLSTGKANLEMKIGNV